MKHVIQILALTIVIPAMALTATARQTAVPSPQNMRVAVQQPPRGTPKQAQQLPRNLTADKPGTPKGTQQQKNRTANAIVDRYIGGFQNQVGLNDEQTRKFSGRLGNYVRQQLQLAERRNEALNRLKELNDQKAPEEEIQKQNKILEQAEARQVNAKIRFYSDINPQLTATQQAKLKLYMESKDEEVRQAIQKSRND
jgi:hypothetical protein